MVNIIGISRYLNTSNAPTLLRRRDGDILFLFFHPWLGVVTVFTFLGSAVGLLTEILATIFLSTATSLWAKQQAPGIALQGGWL